MNAHPIDLFWSALTAIGEAIDEGTLTSNQKVLEELLAMIGTAVSNPYVNDALRRLQTIDDELAFRVAIGEEAVRAMNWNDGKQLSFDT